jgi:hypothetical protein
MKRLVRKEYKDVCAEMKKLEKKGSGGRIPLPRDMELYMRLSAIKNTLEWIHPKMIRTVAKGHDERLNELMSRKHFVMGPTFAELHP